MIAPEQFMEGILRYADKEIIPHLSTAGKWIAGTYVVMASSKYQTLINLLQDSPMIKPLGVFNAEGMIDEKSLFTALKESANKYGKMTISIPVVGTLTFSADDVAVLEKCINGGNLLNGASA